MQRKILISILLAGCWLIQANVILAASLPKGVIVLDGSIAPALKLKNMDGDDFDIANRRGHWLFVHFWATWCGPCRKEMPTIQAILSQLDAQKLEVVLINTAESEDEVFAFLAAVAPDLVPLMDLDGQVTEVWQPRGLPATFLIDPQGRMRFLVLGGRPWDQAEYTEFLKGLYQ